jgi:hypothetical protein
MRYRFAKNRGSFGSALALVVSAMVLPARATNLLVNPGFESPVGTTNPNGDVTGWTLYPAFFTGGDGAARANYQNHTPGGEWSIWLQTFYSAGGVYQNVGNAVAGTNYTLSCDYFFEQNYPPGVLCDLEMTWLNSSGNPVGTAAINQFDGSTQTLGTWLPFTLSATAPAGTAQIQVSFDFSNGYNTGQNGQSAFVDDADLEGAGIPPTTATWAVDTSGDWNSAGNWTTGSIPKTAGVEADFFGAITSPRTIYTDAPITVGTLHFNNANEYEITGTGNLTLQASGSNNALVQVDQGTDELDLPVTIASNTIFHVASGATLIVANPLTVNAGKSISQTGSGTVTYNSLITLQTGASMSLANSTYAHGLTLQGTGAVLLATHTGATQSVFQLDSLTAAGTTNNWTSKLDLTNNALIVHNGNLSAITNQLKTGFNAGSGYWNGTGGIISTAAASDTRHLTTLGSRLSDGTVFDGVNTTTTDVLVKYTYYGDADLNGTVNGADYQQIDNGFGMHLSGWSNGDFNYDGVVDGSDYSLIDNTFNQITATGASPLAISAVASDLIASPSSVPEPGCLGISFVAMAGLLKRGRKGGATP